MVRKIFPFVVLAFAAFLLFWVKRNQRGKGKQINITADAPAFVREASVIIYSKHARCRMECRLIDETEVMEILKNGDIEYDRIDESAKGFTYPLKGYTRDNQHVRVVFAPHSDTLVVVTVIDLENDRTCSCN